VPPGLKLATEFIGIVERAVVDEGDFPRGVNVGVGVFVRLSSVGGPAGVGYADVVAFGGDGSFFNEFDSVCFFSLGGVLCDDETI